MSRYKICVYAICKNEEKFVDHWMDAVSEADCVIVIDTGSQDGTIARLQARGAVVYSESVAPWRFDTARNLALEHVPEDVDICVSIDLDEILEPGWRQRLEEAWQPEHTRAQYLYSWSYHSDGTPDKQFVREKIHARHSHRWIRPVHEILEYLGEGEEKQVWVDGLVLNHHPDLEKSRAQYLPLLELASMENPQDDRTMFWLGREYMYYEMYDKCIETLQKHLKLPTAVWDEERCASMRFIAECYRIGGNKREARRWLYRAIAECPYVREPYCQMAKLGYEENDWLLVYLMIDRMLSILVRSNSYLTEDEAWGYNPYDFGAICCYWLGLYQKAHEYCRKACEMEPGDQRLCSNLALIETKL